MRKSLGRHLDAVKSGTVTKTNVIGIRKIINELEREDNVPADEIDAVFELEQLLSQAEPRVADPALIEGGRALLTSPRYAKRLAPVAAIVAGLESFRLVRFDRFQMGRGSRWFSVPVYRAVSPAGDFLFRNIPWQSGGNGPELVQ